MPKVSKSKTLYSTNFLPIDIFQCQWNEKLPWMFILGVFHGDETEGEYLIERLLDELPAKAAYNLMLLPCLNPDGKQLKTRENANKVDLNRNYPTANFASTSVNPHSGTASAGTPGSEMETRLMMSLVQTYEPARIISIHSDLHVVDYDGPAKEWAENFAKLCGYKLVENVGYPCTGSFGTWAGIERQIPLITLETWAAKNEADLQKIWQECAPALLASITGKI